MAYETNAWGLDLSHYDVTVDAEQLEGVCDFLTIKAGGSDGPVTDIGRVYQDARFAERVQMAYDIGVPCGAYWYAAPRYWLEKMQTMPGIDNMTDEQHPLLQFIMQTLKNKLIYWLAFDVEDGSLLSSAGQVTDVWIRYYIFDLVQRIQRQQSRGNMRPFKLGVYSRRTFIDDKGQVALNTYLGTQPDLFIWTANWMGGVGELTTPADVKAQHRPGAEYVAKSFGYCPTRPLTWQFWQCNGDSGRVFTTNALQNDKGLARAMDVDLYNGTVDQFKAWAGIGVTPEPEPEPEPEPGPEGDWTAAIAQINTKLDNIGKHFTGYSAG